MNMNMELVIENLRVAELVDTGSYFDAQDPALSITVGKTTHITDRKVDAKIQASFDEKFTFPLSSSEYDDPNFSILVEVFNVGITGSKVHVGKGSIPLKSAIKAPNEPFQLVVELTHESKKKITKQGKAFFSCMLKIKQEKVTEDVAVPKKPPVEAPQPSSTTPATNPQAAAVQQKGSSPPVVNASSKPLEASTIDANISKDKAPVKTIVVEQRVLPNLLPSRKYKLTVSKLVAADLFDTGSMLDGQDPCLELTVGKETFQTARQVDAGTKAKFPETFEWTLASEEIERGTKIEAEVVNKNMMGNKTHIGSGAISLVVALSNLEISNAACINLAHKGKSGLEEKGYLTFDCKLSLVQDEVPSVSQKPDSPPMTEKAPATQENVKPAGNDGSKIKTAIAEKLQETQKLKQLKPLLPGKYKLTVSKLVAADLFDTGSMLDGQDPCLELTVGKETFQTARQVDAGTKAKFPETFEWTLASEDITNNLQMSVEVVNKSMLGGKTHIGSGSIAITAALEEAEKSSDIMVTLIHHHKSNNAEKGYISMEGKLSKIEEKKDSKVNESEKQLNEKPTQPMQPSSNEKGITKSLSVQPGNYLFILSKLRVSDLYNTGSALDKQDPSVVLTIGKQKFQTERQKDKGTEADFPESFEFVLTAEDINQSCNINVKVVNVGIMGGKTHVGSGTLPLSSAIMQVNTPNKAKINLAHQKSKTQTLEKGCLEMECLLKPQLESKNSSTEKLAATATSTVKLPLPKGNYKILFTDMEVFDLFNAGNLLDKQDPCVEISLNSQKLQTARQKDAGTQANFPESLEFTVTSEESLKDLLVKLEVLNMSKYGAGVHVGVVNFNLKEYITSISSNFPLSFDLQHVAGSKSNLKGRVNLYCQLIPLKEIEKDMELEVLFTSLKVSGMKNVEFMPLDKNDLYIVAQIGSMFSLRTATKAGAGDAASWDYQNDEAMLISEENVCITTAKQLSTTGITVQCWDENSLRDHTLIGEGQYLVPSTWFSEIAKAESKEANIVLYDKNKRTVGTAVLLLDVYEQGKRPTKLYDNKVSSDLGGAGAKPKADPEKQRKIQDFQAGTLKISKIVCTNLKNVESMGGKNDPFVIATLQSQSYKTDVAEEGGSDVIFPYLDMSFPVSRDILQFETIKLQVFDKNNLLSDKAIGSNQLNNLLFALEHIDEEIEVPIDVLDNGNPTGKLIITMKLTPTDTAINKKLAEGLKTFSTGEIEIVRVRVSDVAKIKNQSLYLNLSFDEWKYKSTVIDLSRVSIPVFENLLDTIFRVTSMTLSSTVMRGELLLKGLISDTSLGRGSCSLQYAVVNLGEEYEISMDLTDNKGSSVGKLIFFVKLRSDAMLQAQRASKLPENFVKGVLKIQSITANGLKNTEFLGKQDPFISLQFGDWKERTKTQDNQGSDSVWENLNFGCPVSKEDLLSNPSKRLLVTAFDDNVSRKDTFIGSGELDVFPAASNLEKSTVLTLKLFDSDNKTMTGRIQLNCTLTQQTIVDETKITIPANFPATFLAIKKIAAKSLQSGNVFSGSKPKVEMVYRSTWKECTPVKEEFTDNSPIWDYLEWQSPTEFEISSEILGKENIVFNYYDNNKLIASGLISNLLLATTRLGNTTDYTIDLVHTKSKKPSGQLTISLVLDELTNRKQKITETTTSEADLMPKLDYTEGELHVSSIQITQLINREIVGQADPFVILQFGNWASQTPVLSNAGSNILWDNLSVTSEATVDEFLGKPLELIVMDKNELLKNTLLGKVLIPLKRLVYYPNKEIEIVDDLKDSKQKLTGKIIIRAQIRKIDANRKLSTIPNDVKDIQLNINRIHLFELINKELIGKQDPFVVVKIGKVWKDQTPVKEDGGSDVLFDNLDISTPNMLTSLLQKEVLAIEVFDQDVTGKKDLGRGSIPLRQINALDKEFQLPITLQSTNSDITGRALVFVTITKPKPKDTPEDLAKVKIHDGFTYGTLSIRRVGAYNLRNVNLITKQDPYVQFQFGDWIGKTNTIQNGGKDCVWDLLDLTTSVSADMLRNLQMIVTVKSKSALNITSDSKHDDTVGTSTASIIRVGEIIGKETKIEVPLLDAKTQKSAGKLIFYVDVQPEEKEANYTVPESFSYGQLKIFRIDAFHLKNTELLGLGKQDPFITLSLGDFWSEKTYTLENISNSSARWDFLPFQCDLYKDQIINSTLTINVSDENTGRKSSLIGKAEGVSIAKCCHYLSKDVEIKVSLVDSTGKSSGKLVLYCNLSLVPPDRDLPKDFASGVFRIKRLSIFGIKATAGDFLGLDKLDPFISLGIPMLPDFTVKTNVVDNAGGNITWNHLDFQTIVDKKVVKIGELICDVFDANQISSNTKLGTAKCYIKKFANDLGTDIEVTGDIVSAKGQCMGRLSVLGNIEPQAVVRKADMGLPKDFAVGTLTIVKLQAKNLKNTEWLGKQDPYARINLGDWWNETTPTLENAGSNPLWTNLSLQTEVNREILEENQARLIINFLDENFSRGDVPLGTGSVSIQSCCSRLNEEVSLPFDLKDTKGSLVGKAMLTARLAPGKLEDMNDGLPESVVTIDKGLMKIYEIAGTDLVGIKSLVNAMAPNVFVMLQIGTDWSNQTSAVSTSANKNPTWQNIPDLETQLTKDGLLYQRLSVTLMSKGNALSGDAILSKGDMSLRKLAVALGKMELYNIRLKDARGRFAGKLDLRMALTSVTESSSEKNAPTETVMGKLQFSKCVVTDVKNTATLGKQDLYAKVALPPTNWNHMLPIQKGAGTSTVWNEKFETNTVANMQLLQSVQGIKIEVFAKGVMSDTLVGEVIVKAAAVVDCANQWCEYKEKLILPGGGTGKFAGKLQLAVRFATDKELVSDWLTKEIISASVAASATMGTGGGGGGGGGGGSNIDLSGLQSSQDSLLKKVNKLESGLKSLLQQELQQEHANVKELLEMQQKEFSSTIDKLSKTLAKQLKQAAENATVAPIPVPQPEQELPPITKVELPKNIMRWRTPHVQAWLAFQLELSQYVPNFANASVDGLVLLQHLDSDMLQQHLDIKNPIHLTKILAGIDSLQQQQRRYEELVAEEKRKKAEKEAAEIAKRDKLLADKLAAELARQAKENQGTKKKRKQGKMIIGEYMNTGIERIKLEKAAKDLQRENKKKAQEHEQRGKVWAFEYTGGQTKQDIQSVMNNHWDTMTQKQAGTSINPDIGTDTYQKVMLNDIVNEILPANQRKSRMIPANCTPEEVLAVVKGAMFDVSTWLLHIEEKNFQKQLLLDEDLVDVDMVHEFTEKEVEDDDGEASGIQQGNDYELPSYNDVFEAADVFEEASKVTSTEKLPGYDELIDQEEVLNVPALTASAIPPRKLTNLTAKLTFRNSSSLPFTEPCIDRMTLIFNAMIHQQNNNARWLGSNEKLTRLKLSGGLESLLKLQLDWSQFDTLWTKLDYKRSGDIDLKEFKSFFGDLSEFETKEGKKSMTLTTSGAGMGMTGTHGAEITTLTKYLYQLCDILRYAGFTIVEMFASFDRNGSREISLSEFCSLLRKLLNDPNMDKRMIYRALSVLDVDGSKSITLEEMLLFIYRIWKSQLDDLANQIYQIQEDLQDGRGTVQDEKFMSKLIQERNDIKQAIKKNFPRQWRDKLERESNGHEIPGPFASLLQRMGIDGTADMLQTALARTGLRDELTSPMQTQTMDGKSSGWMTDMPGSKGISMQSPLRKKRLLHTANSAGHNQLLTMKLKLPAGYTTRRGANTLRMPTTKNLHEQTMISGEVTQHVLSSLEHLGKMM